LDTWAIEPYLVVEIAEGSQSAMLVWNNSNNGCLCGVGFLYGMKDKIVVTKA
jgi:hypothetical protein